MTGPDQKASQVPASDPAADSAPDPIGPITRAILAGVAMRTGSTLLKRSVDRGIIGAAPEALKAAAKAAKPKRSLGARLLTAAATRIATRSVPGAIIVGGALLAKSLHNHRKNRKA